MARQNISSGTTWEASAGYSRAVRMGNLIWVSGTTAADENTQPVAVGDAYGQTMYIFRKIERALHQAGATLKDVVRTRTYITNGEDTEAVSRAHGEIFGEIRPANTLIVVAALVGTEYLVEIEVDAYLESPINPSAS
ncbi:MAG: RidA family protein [Anaerolineae bacterium]